MFIQLSKKFKICLKVQKFLRQGKYGFFFNYPRVFFVLKNLTKTRSISEKFWSIKTNKNLENKTIDQIIMVFLQNYQTML
jgi:hypothetical protein